MLQKKKKKFEKQMEKKILSRIYQLFDNFVYL